MDWNAVLTELLKLILAAAVPFVVIAIGRLAVAALKAAQTYLDQHDLGVAETVANAAIQYAEDKLQGITGPERMAWVLRYLEGRGLDVDEVEAQALYREFARYYKRETSTAETPATDGTTATFTSTMPLATGADTIATTATEVQSDA